MEFRSYILHLEKLLYIPESEIKKGIFANYCLGCGKLMKVTDYLRDIAHYKCWFNTPKDLYCYHEDFDNKTIFLDYKKDNMKLQIKNIEQVYNISKLQYGFNLKRRN